MSRELTSSELDVVVEMEFQRNNKFGFFASQFQWEIFICTETVGWWRLHFWLIFLRFYDQTIRGASLNFIFQNPRWPCAVVFVKFHDETLFFVFRKPIVAMSVRWIIFLFFSCVYREKTFKRKLSIWVNERCAKKNRLEQLTNKFAKWASCLLFFSPFLGSGYNELFGVVCASVCVWLCKTVSFYVSLSITKCS